MDRIINELERVIDPENLKRGLKGSWLKGELDLAATSLIRSNKVLIVTGFCIPEMQVGETDGPAGAIALAYALKALGKSVSLGTDRYSLVPLRSAAGVVELRDAVINLEHRTSEAAWDAVVFIERPGKAKDGSYHNMRGEDISAYTLDTDVLFLRAQAHGIPVIAIGDGGNEAGMGTLSDQIHAHVPHGEKIGAMTKADYLILSGISNWGGYALSAALQTRTGKPCLYRPVTEEAIIKALVDAGAVDGVTKQRTYSVDGLDLETYLKPIRTLYDLAQLNNRKSM